MLGNEGSATVTINPIPADVSVSGGTTQCGGSVTLTASGGGGEQCIGKIQRVAEHRRNAITSQSGKFIRTYYFSHIMEVVGK